MYVLFFIFCAHILLILQSAACSPISVRYGATEVTVTSIIISYINAHLYFFLIMDYLLDKYD